MLKKLVYFCVALLSTTAFAQQNRPINKQQPINKTSWAAEPTSVFGIKLGMHITESGLSACPPNAYKIKLSEPCYETFQLSNTHLKINGLPEMSFPLSATATLVDSTIESIVFSLSHDNFDKFVSILKEKYGPIHQTHSSIVTTKSGGKFSNSTHEWIGKSTSIRALERSGSIDESFVVFSNNELQKLKMEQSAEAKKRDANKL